MYVMNYQCTVHCSEPNVLTVGNSMKYRVDKPIADILEMLVKVRTLMAEH